MPHTTPSPWRAAAATWVVSSGMSVKAAPAPGSREQAQGGGQRQQIDHSFHRFSSHSLIEVAGLIPPPAGRPRRRRRTAGERRARSAIRHGRLQHGLRLTPPAGRPPAGGPRPSPPGRGRSPPRWPGRRRRRPGPSRRPAAESGRRSACRR